MRYEVFYSYCVDASTVIEAETKDEAEEKVEVLWKKGDVTAEKLQDFADFEVLNTRKVPYTKKNAG